jgi:hypothetical protein
MNYSGIAAADDLDRLNSADDFEPATDIDTVALDATLDAITEADRLVAALAAVRDALASGADATTVAGLSLDVHLAMDALGMLTAELSGHEPRKGGVVL